MTNGDSGTAAHDCPAVGLCTTSLSRVRRSLRFVLLLWFAAGWILVVAVVTTAVARWKGPHPAVPVVEILALDTLAIAPSGTLARTRAHAHPAVVPAQVPCAPEVLTLMSGGAP